MGGQCYAAFWGCRKIVLDADKLSQSKDFPCFGLPEGVHTEGSQKPKVLGKRRNSAINPAEILICDELYAACSDVRAAKFVQSIKKRNLFYKTNFFFYAVCAFCYSPA